MNHEALISELIGLACRMQCRVDAIEERDGKEGAITGPGIGIGYLLCQDIVRALNRAHIALNDDEEMRQRILREVAP